MPKPLNAAVPRPPNSRQPKVRGEWVEMKFMVRAAEAGLTVSKPYGDSAQFDFIVGQREPLYRVQVRGTSIKGKRCYLARLTHCYPPRPYEVHDFDFIAVYVLPCDLWYIVPMAAIRMPRYYLSLYPHVRDSRGGFEKYREAFHLLGN